MQALLIVAVALSALVSTVSAVSAAPIQGVLNPATGSVVANGFTGEIFVALRGPEGSLLWDHALTNPPFYTLTAEVPGEIAYLGLGGINGSVNFGNVVKPGLSIAELSNLKLVYQVSFTSDLAELPRFFIPLGSSLPPEQPGLFIIVPEPASCMLLLASAGVLLAAHRLRRGRQRCLAVSS